MSVLKPTKIVCLLSIIVAPVFSGEWLTTSGQFCLEKCKFHMDGYPFYWCHVADMTKVYSDGAGDSFGWSSGPDNSPDTRLKWDYCVPSEFDEANDPFNPDE